MTSHLTVQPAQALPAVPHAQESADVRAVRRWLLIYQARSTHTARSYAQEARRWRLFLSTRHGERPDLLFLATEADVLAYRLVLTGESSGFRPYLVDSRLLAQARFKAQPFTRALKPASVSQAVAILHALYEFLQRPDDGGLQMRENPLWRMKRAIRAPIVATKRVLTPAALEAMLETGAAGGEDIFDRPRYRRALWITQLLLGQWLRRAEAANLAMSDFEMDARGKWTVKVLRKGGKTQVLPVLESTLAGLRTYREGLGLPADPRPGETLPAVLPLEPKVGGKKLTGTTLYNEVKWLAERTRDRLSGSAQCTAADLYSLGNCSPHWFRHSGVSRSLNGGAKLALVSRMAGHASVNTTTALYFHEDLDAMREDLNHLK